VRLSGILGRVGSKAIYTYDFGDSWEHGIVLEKRLPVEQNITYPVCTDGQLACPPEDCGGIPGFYDLVEALNRQGQATLCAAGQWKIRACGRRPTPSQFAARRETAQSHVRGHKQTAPDRWARAEQGNLNLIDFRRNALFFVSIFKLSSMLRYGGPKCDRFGDDGRPRTC
jgi:hypothetical protein